MIRSKTDHKMHLNSQVKGEFYMQVDLTIWRQRGKQDANFTRKHTLVEKKPRKVEKGICGWMSSP